LKEFTGEQQLLRPHIIWPISLHVSVEWMERCMYMSQINCIQITCRCERFRYCPCHMRSQTAHSASSHYPMLALMIPDTIDNQFTGPGDAPPSYWPI
jgi:hypothetical protein